MALCVLGLGVWQTEASCCTGPTREGRRVHGCLGLGGSLLVSGRSYCRSGRLVK